MNKRMHPHIITYPANTIEEKPTAHYIYKYIMKIEGNENEFWIHMH